MDGNGISTPASELQTATESSFIYEYVTTVNPLDIQMVDQVPETNADELDGMFVFYGLGGILAFFVIYMLIYRYCIHCKEVVQRQEAEIRELYERASRTSYRPPMNRGRTLTDEFTHMRSSSLTIPAQAEGGCTPNNLNVNQEEKKEETLWDLPKISCRDPQEILARKYLPENNVCPNTKREDAETSDVSENTNSLGSVESCMLVPPLCFSTPQDSTERIFYPEDFKDLLCPNAAEMQKDESSNESKSDAENATPTKDDEKHSPRTPERKSKRSNENKSDEDATPTKDEKQSPLTPERKSNSSPTSPEIVRRRLTKSEYSPRRPFSWQ